MKKQFTGKETQMAVTNKFNGDQENANLNHKILLHTHQLVNPKRYLPVLEMRLQHKGSSTPCGWE